MNAPNQVLHYSAAVQIQLFVNGHVFSVAQLGPDFIVLRDSIDLPSALGEILLSIDGEVARWSVYLIDGIKSNKQKTRISDSLPPGDTAPR